MKPKNGTPQDHSQFKKRGTIVYDDGRPGYQNVKAVVLSRTAKGMIVQFEDRADTTYIPFSDRAWMDFISVGK